jgi:hypothetical protein
MVFFTNVGASRFILNLFLNRMSHKFMFNAQCASNTSLAIREIHIERLI